MDAADFQAAWEATGDTLYRFPTETVSVSRMPESAKQFLESAGLPQEAAPFLSFGPGGLDWLRRPGDDLDRYYAVGTDASGDPLVVDEDGVVWLIDHEAPDHRTLVNSSVQALADCLLAYRNLVVETVATGGEDALLNGLIPRRAIEACSGGFSAVDSVAVRSGTFWGQELSRLFAEASA